MSKPRVGPTDDFPVFAAPDNYVVTEELIDAHRDAE